MKRNPKVLLFLLLALPLPLFAGDFQKTIPTVDQVELDSYVGLWHEVRRIKNSFQDNVPSAGDSACFNTTAEYSPLPEGKIKVKNTCYRTSGVEVATAKARSVRGSNNAKLKVNFTGIPFFEWLGIGDGDYWILALGQKNADNLYSWALVGAPNLKFGWILSRTPELPEGDIDMALSVAQSVGYDRESFISFQK